MIEVKYTRWKALLQVAFGLLLSLGGLLLLLKTKEPAFAGAIGIFTGPLFMQRARARLKQGSVILRLTPNLVWTKGLGWQPWENLLFTLDRYKNKSTIEIHRLAHASPRFFEGVGELTIKEGELVDWIKRFATNYRLDSQEAGEAIPS